MREWRDCTNCYNRGSDNLCVVKGVKVLEEGCDPFSGCGHHEFEEDFILSSKEADFGYDYSPCINTGDEDGDIHPPVSHQEWDDEEFPF